MGRVRSLLRRGLHHAVRHDRVWTILDSTLLPFARRAQLERARSEYRRLVEKSPIVSAPPRLTVRHGPFRGMRLPEGVLDGYPILSTILGSYESEIAPVIERICATGYSQIVNVGCAEGYYAVGLALRVPAARVFAYDADEGMRRLCEETIALNDVADRVVTGNRLDAQALASFPFRDRALILSDCEGHEKELFTRESAAACRSHDLLVEIHDCLDIEISTHVRDLFEATHEIEVYRSVDDVEKPRSYVYPELRDLDLPTRRTVLAEGRSGLMEWFFMRSREPVDSSEAG